MNCLHFLTMKQNKNKKIMLRDIFNMSDDIMFYLIGQHVTINVLVMYGQETNHCTFS